MKTIEEEKQQFLNSRLEADKQCGVKHRNKQSAINMRSDAFASGVLFAQRWISVEEEMPEKDNEPYLVKYKNYALDNVGGIFKQKEILQYGIGVFYDGLFYDNYSYLMKVTHWRPIEIK